MVEGSVERQLCGGRSLPNILFQYKRQTYLVGVLSAEVSGRRVFVLADTEADLGINGDSSERNNSSRLVLREPCDIKRDDRAVGRKHEEEGHRNYKQKALDVSTTPKFQTWHLYAAAQYASS